MRKQLYILVALAFILAQLILGCGEIGPLKFYDIADISRNDGNSDYVGVTVRRVRAGQRVGIDVSAYTTLAGDGISKIRIEQYRNSVASGTFRNGLHWIETSYGSPQSLAFAYAVITIDRPGDLVIVVSTDGYAFKRVIAEIL